MKDTDNNPKQPFPIRRLCFTACVIIVMAIAALASMYTGYLLVKDSPGDAALGTVALVVSPAVALMSALGPILTNLLREE